MVNKIKQEIQDIEEPFIYNAIDIIKNNLEESLNEANIVSFLNELKLNNTQNLSLENALFTITKANKDCPDFLYEEKDELINTNTSKEISKEKKETNSKNDTNIANKNLSDYDLFFECGGVKTEILAERDYVFQSHGIRVKSMEEIEKYKEMLFSNNKIQRAARNI